MSLMCHQILLEQMERDIIIQIHYGAARFADLILQSSTIEQPSKTCIYLHYLIDGAQHFITLVL
jgi:hypothetical protein